MPTRPRPRRPSSEDKPPPDRWDDLAYTLVTGTYERLSSRKLWLTIAAIAFAYWNYHGGALTPAQFQTAVSVAVLGFLGAEGVVDASAAFGARREQVRQDGDIAAIRAAALAAQRPASPRPRPAAAAQKKRSR